MTDKPDLPANRVSRNTKAKSTCDHRAGMVIIKSGGDGVISASCGWFATHPRRKVREDKAERHIDGNHHGGNAIWL